MICVIYFRLVENVADAHHRFMSTPIRPMDDEARKTVATLLSEARHCALAYTDLASGAPSASRIAILTLPGTGLITLVSELSQHTAALQSGGPCALLVGEPAYKGDALTAPRITLHARPKLAPKQPLRDAWLEKLPKSALYFDFADFIAFRFDVQNAFLNGGFGKAYEFKHTDLLPYVS